MKKYIRGKLYDTTTAKVVTTVETAEIPVTDFRYSKVTLYRKKSGEYFALKSSPSLGAEITPLTYDQAEKMIGSVGDVADEPLTEKIYINISASARRKLDKMRAESGKNLSAVIDELIKNGGE